MHDFHVESLFGRLCAHLKGFSSVMLESVRATEVEILLAKSWKKFGGCRLIEVEAKDSGKRLPISGLRLTTADSKKEARVSIF